jgi:hypothetical protein
MHLAVCPEWLADVLGISPGGLRMSVSRVLAALGARVLETGTTGYALVATVDAAEFCQAGADAADAEDRIHALQDALARWHGPPLDCSRNPMRSTTRSPNERVSFAT